jgi:hypothetical protein
MANKYKISKQYLGEFFGLFGNKKEDRTKKINDLIDNDPILKKLDKEIGDLNDKAAERLKKDVDAMKILKKLGIEIK